MAQYRRHTGYAVKEGGTHCYWLEWHGRPGCLRPCSAFPVDV